jgi:hypothetical protein
MNQEQLASALLVARIENSGGGARMSDSDRELLMRLPDYTDSKSPLHERVSTAVRDFYQSLEGANDVPL